MDLRRILPGMAIAAVAIVGFLALRPGQRPGLSSPSEHGGITANVRNDPVAQVTPDPEEPSRLAAGLNSPAGDIHADLRMVNQVFDAYRGALHGGNPVGENAEITAALTGKNRLGYAFIPRNSPAINSKGQLCDRWGRPFFFHQLSGEKMEVRSAGPDLKLWTADDEVLTP